MAQIIADVEYVECGICGMKSQMLTHTHFKYKHGLTFKEYQEKFPNAPTITLTKELLRKSKISEKTKGRAAHNKGQTLSSEQRNKISETKKHNFSTGDTIHWNLGNTCPDHVKAKISKSVSSVKYTDEQMQAINQKRRETKKRQIRSGWINPLKGVRLVGDHLDKSRIAILKASQIKSLKSWDIIFQKCNLAGLVVNSIDKNDGNRMHLTCNKCFTNFSFQSQIFRDCKNKGIEVCPTCYPRETGSSIGERELYSFIKQFYPSAIANDRELLGEYGKEIDIYIPDLKLAIEYDGLYYHSDNVHSIARNLKDKTTRCNSLGITIIHVFEDEWRFCRDIVESRLKQILKVNKNKVKFARKLTILPISYKHAADFLSNYHLQGKDNSKIRYGAFDNEELLAVMTFKPSNFTKGGDGSIIELSRFAIKSEYHIPGIASRLFNKFVNEYNPQSVLSYADKRWSVGNLYKTLGFMFQGDTPPDYWYFLPNEGIRYHRSNFMKHLLVNAGASPDKTESEIMQEKGYLKIYDCGSSKWIWMNTK